MEFDEGYGQERLESGRYVKDKNFYDLENLDLETVIGDEYQMIW